RARVELPIQSDQVLRLVSREFLHTVAQSVFIQAERGWIICREERHFCSSAADHDGHVCRYGRRRRMKWMLRKDFAIDRWRKSPDGLINAARVTNHCEVCRHDPLHWQLLHLVYVGSGDSQFGQKLIGVSYRRVAIDDLYCRTALD